MKRAGVGVAIVAVVVVCWLLLDASGVLRSERRAPERATATRDDVSDVSENVDSDSPDSPAKDPADDQEAPAIPAPVDLTKVDLDRDLHGIVVDTDGKPIPGAKLQTISYPTRRAGMLNRERYYDEVLGPSTQSASDGTFAVRLTRGALWSLRITAKGFATTQLKQRMAGEYVKVVLSAGVDVVVIARDEQKQPVVGVNFRIFSNARSQAQVTRYGTTDERGQARFEDMPAGLEFWVETRHDQLGSPGWVELKTQESGEQRLELTLPKGRTLTGIVTDAETDAPIKGAKVGMGWSMRQHTFTDERGDYSLSGWSGKGVLELSVDSPLHAAQSQRVGAKDRIDFQLKPGGAASGRVINEAGEPVSGARVDTVGSRNMGRVQVTSRRYARSDEHGRFRFEGLNLELQHGLVVIAEGYGRKLVDFQPARPEKDLGDVTLSRARSIEGVVLDGDKQPLPRLKITLHDAGPRERSWPRIMYGNSESRYTDHLGRFRFPGQSPGKFKLSVRRIGYQPAERVVELTSEKDLLGVEVSFLPGKEFVVWAHDEDGKPIVGAFASVQYEGGSAQALTDEKGAARFNVTGAVTSVRAPWLADESALIRPTAVMKVDPSQNEVRFVFKKGAVITGTVMLDGKPLAHARLDVLRSGKRRKMVTVGEDGTFRIVGSPDEGVDLILRGRYIMDKRGGMQADRSTQFTGELRNIAPGSKDVVVRAHKAPNDGTITVRVLDADGKPVVGVTVSIGNTRGATGENGAVTFEALPRAAILVNVGTRPNLTGQLPPAPFNVTPAGQEVVLSFEKGVPVSGTVTDADGKPAASVPIFAIMQRRYLGSGVTDADGRFTIYVPDKFEGKVTIMANFRRKDGVIYTARAEYVHGATIRMQLAKR